ENAFAEGMTFDGSAIDGFSRVQESDMLAFPDPNTFGLLPWRGEDAPVARMFCDVSDLDGTAFAGDPRAVLRRNLDRAREPGVALERGVHATFMPKPLAGVQGSGMHTHFSLFEGDTNAFYDPGDEFHLSKVAKGFIAGLLRHAREITAITNQWVNSYKRLVVAPGNEAPVYVAWARNNRSALVRVPGGRKGKESSTRIEFRSPDPACNPYLAFACVLSAGLEGVEEGYDLSPELTANLYEMTAEERLAEGVTALPGSLEEAVIEMEQSELVAEAL